MMAHDWLSGFPEPETSGFLTGLGAYTQTSLIDNPSRAFYDHAHFLPIDDSSLIEDYLGNSFRPNTILRQSTVETSSSQSIAPRDLETSWDSYLLEIQAELPNISAPTSWSRPVMPTVHFRHGLAEPWTAEDRAQGTQLSAMNHDPVQEDDEITRGDSGYYSQIGKKIRTSPDVQGIPSIMNDSMMKDDTSMRGRKPFQTPSPLNKCRTPVPLDVTISTQTNDALTGALRRRRASTTLPTTGARRKGQLSPELRKHAAQVRRIGACKFCRQKKIKVRSLFATLGRGEHVSLMLFTVPARYPLNADSNTEDAFH